MFQIRTDIRVCTRVCRKRKRLFCSLVRVQQIIPLGGTHRFHFDLMMEGKKEREREREKEGEIRQGLERDCREWCNWFR